MPIYTRCLRPDDYEDTRLFVPCQEVEHVQHILAAFLDGPGSSRRLLVTGERGIGKSIGVRAALVHLQEERRDFFPVIVAADRCLTVRLGPISQKELLVILERRLEVDCRDAEALRRAGLLTIARGLTRANGGRRDPACSPLVLRKRTRSCPR